MWANPLSTVLCVRGESGALSTSPRSFRMPIHFNDVASHQRAKRRDQYRPPAVDPFRTSLQFHCGLRIAIQCSNFVYHRNKNFATRSRKSACPLRACTGPLKSDRISRADIRCSAGGCLRTHFKIKKRDSVGRKNNLTRNYGSRGPSGETEDSSPEFGILSSEISPIAKKSVD